MTDQSAFEVILVDDEADFLLYEREAIEGLGFKARSFDQAESAIDYISTYPDRVLYVVSDLHMPTIDGFTLRERVREIDSSIPFAFVSAYLDLDLAQKAMRSQVSAVLDKPIDHERFKGAIYDDLKARSQTLTEKAVIREIFVTETKQILDELEPLLLSLEQCPSDADLINEIFRLVHTVKGSSSFLQNHSLPKYAHKFENLLSAIKGGAASVTSQIVDSMLEGLDVMVEMTSNIESGEYKNYDVEELGKIFSGERLAQSRQKKSTSSTKVEQKGQRSKPDKDFIRVPIKTLDEFMEISGEVTIIRNVVTKMVKSLEKQYPSNKDLSLVTEMLEEMYKSQSRMVSSVLDMRKIPLFDVFRPFQRMVRDLCQNLNKDVQLNVNGEGLRVDTSLGKVIGDSLVHLIRNSLDHGIEDAELRKKAGKPATGSVSVNCYEAKEEIIIEVADDGDGMNVNAIRDKAVERQLISAEEARTLNDAHIMQLVFESGFSTASQVTDVSGRGVGMDMVKSSVDAIGGHVDVSSERGKGTRFQLRLPVPKSVMIINVILVREADKTFAFPQDRIEHLLQFGRSRKSEYIREMQDTRLLVRDGKLIPLISLRDVLHLEEGYSHQADEVSVVIVKDERVHYAIEVDTILDSEEVVVKPLSNVLGGLNCYLGATLVGVGDVCVIINYEGLAALAGVESHSLVDAKDKTVAGEMVEAAGETDFVLYRFSHSDVVYASPCEAIYRLEHIAPKDIQWSGCTAVFEYRGRIMPIIDTARELGFDAMLDDRSIPEGISDVPLLVVKKGDAYFGFCVGEFVDVLFVTQQVDHLVQDRPGIEGNLTLSGVNYPVIQLEALLPQKMLSEVVSSDNVRELKTEGSEAKRSKGISTNRGGTVATPKGGSEPESDGGDDGVIWVS